MRYRLILLIAALAMTAGQPAVAAEMATYTARYDLALVELKFPGEVKSWKGGAAVRIARDCQKWSIQAEVAFTLVLVGGKVVKFHSTEKYFESIDGARLEFEILRKTNGSITDHRKGVAVLQEKGKPGRITYSKPRGKTLDIPAGAEFPMTATATMVANLAKGKSGWRQIVFLWGELVTLSHSVDKKGVSIKKQPKGDTSLTKFSGWKVNSTARLQESGRNLRLEYLVHPNGLASRHLYEQQIATLSDELVEIEALPAPEC